MHGWKSKNASATALTLLALALAACGGGGGDDNKAAATSGSGTSSTTSPAGGSQTTGLQLSLSGAPTSQVLANQPYWFRPVASTSTGDPPVFGISNQPSWSTFNTATGELRGTPSVADVGLYSGITVTASADGQMRALAFDVEVVQVGTRSVTLSWTPPTENEDGTALTNLAGYRIRYGQQSGDYTSVIDLDNAGLATYMLTGLAAGTYYIVISDYNLSGVESTYSNEATINLSSS
jgi:Fibronectin type III domain